MAKHVAQGKEFPIFFYGQHYAFSPVETVAGALSFLIAGVGAVPLKLAGLALWTLGIVFLFLAQSRLLGAARSFWITAVLVLNPAWAVWSMRDGGGYLTSFAASAALVWLLVQDRERETMVRWLVAGALTSLIYLAQPLWLPGVLPIVVVVLVLRRRPSWALSYRVRGGRGAFCSSNSEPRRRAKRGAVPPSVIPILSARCRASRIKSMWR